MNSLYEIISCSRGTFSIAKLDKLSLKKIEQIQRFFRVPRSIDIKKIHCTIIDTKKEIIGYPLHKHLDIMCNISHFEVWQMEDKERYCLVAILDSPKVTELHNTIKNEYGVEHSFNDYIPHITLSTSVDKYFDVSKINNYYNDTSIRLISQNTETKKAE